MIDYIIYGSILVSLILPLICLIKSYHDSGKWKYNLLRAIYGNLSGIILVGAVHRGVMSIGTQSYDFTLFFYLSFLLLIPVFVDVHKVKGQNQQLKTLCFYIGLLLAVLFFLYAILWELS